MAREGVESPLKLNRILEKIRKNKNWNVDNIRDPEVAWNLCCARLALGELSWEGWGHRIPRDGIFPFDFPWYNDEPVNKLLILSEQGLGDEILFASCFKDVKAREVTVECDARLKPVFERSFPHIEFICRKHIKDKPDWELDNRWAIGRSWDAMVLAGELPTWYRRKLSDFPQEPYLKAEENDLTDMYVGRIGVSWRGRQGGYPVKKFKDHVPDGLSLQYGENSLSEVPEVDLTYDIDGVFSVVAGLNKVVSVPTSIVHIAGSLGIPTDVILPPKGYKHGGFDETVNNCLNWRWRKDFPWHPSVRVFENWEEYESD